MRSLIILVALLLVLEGCAQNDPPAPIGDSPFGTTEALPTYPSQEDLIGGLPVNDRGNVHFNPGELVVSRNPTTGEPVMQYTITSIDSFSCTDKYSQAGPRLRANIKVQTFVDPDGLLGDKSFWSYWEIVAPDGYTQDVNTSPCPAAGKSAPMDLKQSRSYEFSIVLAAPDTIPPGAVLVKYLSYGSTGAEWDIKL